MSVDPSGQLALDLYRQPIEDAGAPTQGNYHYQTEIIASFCLSMPSDPSISKIICEWHEDFLIVRDQPPFLELVSVKHHDHTVYTTMNKLCDEGGLTHLFDKWLGYTSGPAARLASNTRLGGKRSDPSPLALYDVCRTAALATPAGTRLLAHLAWAMMDVARRTAELENLPRPTSPSPPKARRHDPSGLPPGLFDMLLRFMLVFRFDCDRAAKGHIQDINIRQLAEPAMVGLGYSQAAAPDAYGAVAQLIGEASRDRSGRPSDLARFLTNPGAYDPLSELAQTVERRTVSRDAVLAAMRLGARRSAGETVPLLRSGQAPPRAAGGHRLIDKMRLGLLDEAEQDNALRLRDLWLHTWPQAKTGFPEDIETEFRLEMEILDVVRRVRHQLIDKAGPYGVQFQALLHQELREAKLSSKVSVPLDDFHIVGFAYELSDLCKFGFARPGAA
ncbi:dsDNA nuclease domain-containing protein [Solwaraspora sp. WMMD406]|uniref:dsDNA nuclease domain-containing protein n=1 Tax=Solwaraspora sp. WMMD406 TaxID=3016095 RepID=UPI002416C185|nr:dsDNA nuclease domain-containing protein [Solwaraspora sp. WMMD406]MDG4768029.1 dsDNA nuclease domain-containing protein [Solwaraspora sp. WMMD406]